MRRGPNKRGRSSFRQAARVLGGNVHERPAPEDAPKERHPSMSVPVRCDTQRGIRLRSMIGECGARFAGASVPRHSMGPSNAPAPRTHWTAGRRPIRRREAYSRRRVPHCVDERSRQGHGRRETDPCFLRSHPRGVSRNSKTADRGPPDARTVVRVIVAPQSLAVTPHDKRVGDRRRDGRAIGCTTALRIESTSTMNLPSPATL